MKRGINKGVALATVFIAALFGAIALIVSLIIASNQLREFKVDMFVLCNEADICVAEGPEGEFRITKDNLAALNSIINSTRGDFTIGSPEVTDQIALKIDHDDEKWDLTIGRAGENRLMLKLKGPRNYKIYIKENYKYDELLKCVSAKGYHEANKPISTTNESDDM